MAKRQYKLKRDPVDSRDYLFKAIFRPQPLPVSVDNRSMFSPIRDQGDLGSCSAFSSAGGAFEMIEMKGLASKQTLPEEYGPQFEPVSTLMQYQNTLILENSFGDDAGATIRGAVKSLATYGVCKEKTWPYDINNFRVKAPQSAYDEAAKHKIVLYARVTSTYAIKRALAHGLPVILGIMVYASMESDEVAQTGIVPMPGPDEECLGGHAVCLAGYNEKGWIMRNSWGSGWGQSGYCILPHDYIDLEHGNLAMDAWVITK